MALALNFVTGGSKTDTGNKGSITNTSPKTTSNTYTLPTSTTSKNTSVYSSMPVPTVTGTKTTTSTTGTAQTKTPTTINPFDINAIANAVSNGQTYLTDKHGIDTSTSAGSYSNQKAINTLNNSVASTNAIKNLSSGSVNNNNNNNNNDDYYYPTGGSVGGSSSSASDASTISQDYYNSLLDLNKESLDTKVNNFKDYLDQITKLYKNDANRNISWILNQQRRNGKQLGDLANNGLSGALLTNQLSNNLNATNRVNNAINDMNKNIATASLNSQNMEAGALDSYLNNIANILQSTKGTEYYDEIVSRANKNNIGLKGIL